MNYEGADHYTADRTAYGCIAIGSRVHVCDHGLWPRLRGSLSVTRSSTAAAGLWLATLIKC